MNETILEAHQVRLDLAKTICAVMAEHGIDAVLGDPSKLRGRMIFEVSLWRGSSSKVQISRSPHASEGTGTKTVTFQKGLDEGRPTKALLESIERTARDLQRLTARDAAIRRHAHILRPPAWAYTMHQVALSMMKSTGLDPSKVLLPYEGMARFCPTPSETGLTLSVERHPQFEGSSVEARRERIVCAPLRMKLGNEDFSFLDNPKPALRAERLVLPHSVMSAIAGMKLRDVVAHPAFDDLDITIKRAEMVSANGGRERLTLTLPDVQERIVPLPDGETPDWHSPA